MTEPPSIEDRAPAMAAVMHGMARTNGLALLAATLSAELDIAPIEMRPTLLAIFLAGITAPMPDPRVYQPAAGHA